MNPFTRSRTIAVLLGAGALAVAGTTGAVASSMVTSHDIANHTIQARDMANDSVNNRVLKDGAVHLKELSTPLQGRVAEGGLAGARYSVAHYDNGGGGTATVACDAVEAKSQKYTAIAGGAYVQVVDDQGKVVSTDTEPITSSSPGRMDWDTGMPKANRLDGWIVKFGNGTAPTAKAGDVLEVWALCVPTTGIPTVVNHY